MKSITRRRLLAAGAAAGITVATGRVAMPARAVVPPLLDPRLQPMFVNPLPNPLTPGFVLTPTIAADGVAEYTVGMSEFPQKLGLYDPLVRTPLWTTVWGYDGVYPGHTFVVRSGTPVRVKWQNDLPAGTAGGPMYHLLPVDNSVPGASPDLRGTGAGPGVVPHVHGGHTQARYDGTPKQWWTSTGEVGDDFPGTTFTYDNTQEAATIWYHDHAQGITRLNVYAGLAGFYLIRDDGDTGEPGNDYGLPAYPYEIPIAIQDRQFTATGQLYYPTTPLVKGSPDPSIQPEVFGDVVLANGQAWPLAEVEPRRYRLRLLNGCDSRFLSMQFKPPRRAPLPIVQVGTDGGLLPSPSELNGGLVLGPGERADIVVDFAGLEGQTILVNNDAPTPFPSGLPVTPTASKLMAFRVSKPLTSTDAELSHTLRSTPFSGGDSPTTTRKLLLFEGEDEFGRILPQLGTVDDGAMMFEDPTTETPGRNTTEVWEFYNTTPDGHPIHLHQVMFEVLDRTPFKAQQDRRGALRNITLGVPVPAPAGERGAKDTAQMFPRQRTRVKATFDLRGLYVWHCHILSHEEWDMMRPFYVS